MIPILMDSTKTLSTLANDNTNGLGALSECTSCTVKEERNGAFTLDMTIPQSAKHFSDIAVGGIIKAKAREAGDPQMFRIEKITKPIGGMVTIYANHISYDLNKTSVLPFTSVGIIPTLQQLKTKMQSGSAFTFTTDISNPSSSFSNKIPQSARALMGGQEGSLLDIFGGEYLFDNTVVSLLAHRGVDNRVTLRYGKNITDLSQEENIASTYTAIQPYARGKDESVVVGDLLTIISSTEPKILNLDLSDKFQEEEITIAKLATYAQQYATANNVGVPKVSITVSFVALWQTEEYKSFAPLERVSLCDTVTVVFEKLGVNAKAKVISTTYDSLRERYTEIEIGDARSTLAGTMNSIAKEMLQTVSSVSGFLDNTISQFTSLIANGLGLFVTKEEVGETGGYKYYLHNKPTLTESQYQWTFNSNGFAVSTNYGATWSAGIDNQGNAVFNSLSSNTVNAMSINGSTITGGTISGAIISAGGNNNTDGTIQVKNASGTVIGQWNKDGLNVSSGTLSSPTFYFSNKAKMIGGSYTMYDHVEGADVTVYGAMITGKDSKYESGFLVDGGYSLDSSIYPARIMTRNNHRLRLIFGSSDRAIDNRVDSGQNLKGLYIANDTGGSCYICLTEDARIVLQATNGVYAGTKRLD